MTDHPHGDDADHNATEFEEFVAEHELDGLGADVTDADLVTEPELPPAASD